MGVEGTEREEEEGGKDYDKEDNAESDREKVEGNCSESDSESDRESDRESGEGNEEQKGTWAENMARLTNQPIQ